MDEKKDIAEEIKELRERVALLETLVWRLKNVSAVRAVIEQDANMIKSSEIRTKIMLNMNGKSAQEIANIIGKSLDHVRKEISILKNKLNFPYFRTTRDEKNESVYSLTPFGEALLEYLNVSSTLDTYGEKKETSEKGVGEDGS
ncbi:MAG: hypothetical protein QXL15_03530 [Candidatus Korarchaeota archaeon]